MTLHEYVRYIYAYSITVHINMPMSIHYSIDESHVYRREGAMIEVLREGMEKLR